MLSANLYALRNRLEPSGRRELTCPQSGVAREMRTTRTQFMMHRRSYFLNTMSCKDIDGPCNILEVLHLSLELET